MPRILWWIIREGIEYLLISAILSSSGDVSENYTPYNEGIAPPVVEFSPILVDEYIPDWELIYTETTKEYFSHYKISSDPISKNDLFTTLLGGFNNEYATLTITDVLGVNSDPDSIVFNYDLLYNNARILNTGTGYVIPSENLIVLDIENTFSGSILKVENDRNNRSYLLMSATNHEGEELMFLDSKNK